MPTVSDWGQAKGSKSRGSKSKQGGGAAQEVLLDDDFSYGQPSRDDDELEGLDLSDGGTTTDDDVESCDGDDADDLWTDEVKDELIEEYYVFMSRASSCVEDGSPLLQLRQCRHCFSSKVKPVHIGTGGTVGGRRVLLVSSTRTEVVTVPFFCCDAGREVQNDDCCGGPQHVSLLSLGYFPSTLVQARNLTVQKHSGTLVFFHVELLRSFHGLHLHAPGLSTKAWAEHYVDAFGFGVIRRGRLEDLLGKTGERFRDMMHAVSRMKRYDVKGYPGQIPLFGSCPVCAELVNPDANGFPGARVDLQMDACMGLVHYKNTASVQNAERTRPLFVEVRLKYFSPGSAVTQLCLPSCLLFPRNRREP